MWTSVARDVLVSRACGSRIVAQRLLCAARVMTVDADITVEILRDIREEMRGMRGELTGVRGELIELKDHAKVTNQRLEVMEHTLSDFCQQHLMLTRHVGNVDRRQDDDIDDLRVRVTRLERREHRKKS
jgi:hypothetical protein